MYYHCFHVITTSQHFVLLGDTPPPPCYNYAFTFIHLADTFYLKRLIEEYNKRYIIKRQTDKGSACNTTFQALFGANSSQTVRG